MKKISLVIFCFFWAGFASALTFPLPSNGDAVVGEIQYTDALPGDTFSKIGRRYGVGYYQLVEANPDIHPEQIQPGARIVVPTAFILPAGPRTGVVINLAELRMYYYPPDGKTVETYPLGIGRDGWNTPLGMTKITEKTKNPTWIPPKSIRDFRKTEGVDIPPLVRPGVDNPLGGYRLRLAIPTGAYLIHGTNNPNGVGRRSSSGCINMFPEDVEVFFERVKSGTPVRMINEPYKVGRLSGALYLEAHLPLDKKAVITEDNLTPLVKLVEAAKGTQGQVNWELANTVVRTQKGIPDQIGVAQGS